MPLFDASDLAAQIAEQLPDQCFRPDYRRGGRYRHLIDGSSRRPGRTGEAVAGSETSSTGRGCGPASGQPLLDRVAFFAKIREILARSHERLEAENRDSEHPTTIRHPAG